MTTNLAAGYAGPTPGLPRRYSQPTNAYYPFQNPAPSKTTPAGSPYMGSAPAPIPGGGRADLSGIQNLSWASSPPSQMQPCWNIWGPVGQASPGAISAAAFASPPKASPDFGEVVGATAKNEPRRLWFGTGPSGAPASPPLTPQTSPGLDVRRFSASNTTRDMQAQSLSEFQDLVSTLGQPDEPLCFVKFKSGRVDVFAAPERTDVSVGELVIVDADRGRDLGEIVAHNVSIEQAAMLKWRQHQEQQQVLHQSTAGKEPPAAFTMSTPKLILRAAQPGEIQQLSAKSTAESRALALCTQKVRERGLEMEVVDAEYQWDRRKSALISATWYVISSGPIRRASGCAPWGLRGAQHK